MVIFSGLLVIVILTSYDALVPSAHIVAAPPSLSAMPILYVPASLTLSDPSAYVTPLGSVNDTSAVTPCKVKLCATPLYCLLTCPDKTGLATDFLSTLYVTDIVLLAVSIS